MKRPAFAAAAIALVWSAPVTPQGSISANDRAQGARADPELVQQYGGAMTGRTADYVAGVGRRMAIRSGLSTNGGDIRVTLLNSNVNNAFALPGGYVYVTRQLVALMNDEAELAFVMGHEIGHVAGRHATSRNRTSTVGSIGSMILGVLTGSSAIAQYAGQAAQLYTLRFSRQQEYSADDLGINYLARERYDTLPAPRMLTSLAAQSSLDQRLAGQGEGATATWASTHPDPASRVQRALQRARAAGTTGQSTNRDAFLAAIDGMIYDDDPSQGVVEGRVFRHPGLRIAFTAPQGFAMQNGADAVSIVGRGSQAQFRTARFDGSLPNYVDAAFRELSGGRLAPPEVRSTRIGGFDAAYATTRANTNNGAVDATVFAYSADRRSAYHFVLLTPAGSGIGPFVGLVESFRALSAQEAGAIRPRRVRVITTAPGDTVASVAARMAYPDNREARFRVLNGLRNDEQIRPGRRLKLVVLG